MLEQWTTTISDSGPMISDIDSGAAEEASLDAVAPELKTKLVFMTDHFMSYTAGSRDYLTKLGYPGDKISVLNITIDLDSERALPDRSTLRLHRLTTRAALAAALGPALLVGCLVAPTRRIDINVRPP